MGIESPNFAARVLCDYCVARDSKPAEIFLRNVMVTHGSNSSPHCESNDYSKEIGRGRLTLTEKWRTWQQLGKTAARRQKALAGFIRSIKDGRVKVGNTVRSYEKKNRIWHGTWSKLKHRCPVGQIPSF